MSDLQKDRCTPYPVEEDAPDGLSGKPSERFTQAVQWVFSVTREQMAEAEAQGGKPPQRRGRKPKAAQPHFSRIAYRITW